MAWTEIYDKYIVPLSPDDKRQLYCKLRDDFKSENKPFVDSLKSKSVEELKELLKSRFWPKGMFFRITEAIAQKEAGPTPTKRYDTVFTPKILDEEAEAKEHFSQQAEEETS